MYIFVCIVDFYKIIVRNIGFCVKLFEFVLDIKITFLYFFKKLSNIITKVYSLEFYVLLI